MSKKNSITTILKKYKITLKEESFCQNYASSKEFFGNGTQSYIEAYDPVKVGNWYNTARSKSSILLTKVNILGYIDHLLELRGLNDPFVDKQLEFLITQHGDFGNKLGAIREYNKLKQRITEKIELDLPRRITKIIINPISNDKKK